MTCTKCNSDKVFSIDNLPLHHPRAYKKDELNFENEVYVQFKCAECDNEFQEIFDMVARPKRVKVEIEKKSKSVFEFGDEYVATSFYDFDISAGGVEIKRDDEYLGRIIELDIPDEEDKEANEKFDNKVIAWIVDNEK